MNTESNKFKVMFAPDTDTAWQLHSEFSTVSEAKEMARTLHTLILAHFLVEDNQGNVLDFINANTTPDFLDRQV